MTTCLRMTRELLPDAYALLYTFLTEDEYYLDSGQAYGHRGDTALQNALEMFLARPELGFVWLAYDGNRLAGICVASYAISTSMGALVAKLDDVYVRTEEQGTGIGSELVSQLKSELLGLDVVRIDTSVHMKNNAARQFYLNNGFWALNEERLSCVLVKTKYSGADNAAYFRA